MAVRKGKLFCLSQPKKNGRRVIILMQWVWLIKEFHPACNKRLTLFHNLFMHVLVSLVTFAMVVIMRRFFFCCQVSCCDCGFNSCFYFFFLFLSFASHGERQSQVIILVFFSSSIIKFCHCFFLSSSFALVKCLKAKMPEQAKQQ